MYWGKELLNYNNGYVCTKNITFPSVFSDTPQVQVTIEKDNSGDRVPWNPYVVEGSVTATGCTLGAANGNGTFSAGVRAWVRWSAIGY